MIEQLLTKQQSEFADRLRTELASELPAALARKVYLGEKVSKADYQEWAARVGDRGWITPTWPSSHGGPGWGPVERYLFDQEISLACAPRANLVGTDLLGPALIRHGTPEQQKRFLPGLRNGSEWWCQGFSESGAGSDLAALATRGTRVEGGYQVSGTKLWVSYAHEADWMFCLARTSDGDRKHHGLSMLLLPMNVRGVSVSPITTIGGLKIVNEVHLDQVHVPEANRLGNDGDGWNVARSLLGNERVMGAWLGLCTRCLHQARHLAHRSLRNGRPLAADGRVRDRLAQFEIDLLAVTVLAFRVMQAEVEGHPPGAEVSVLKLSASELHQDLAEFLFDLAGGDALADAHSLGAEWGGAREVALLAQQYFDKRKLTIYGGSAEVQRNLIARSRLGQ